MRSRALFAASPTCLGIYGFPSWTEEAVDELVTDCYTAVFLRRLPSLAAQLERKANVEGIVFANVRHYLHEIQRKHDPVGFRVYTALRAAVCAAVDRGVLRVELGDPAIRNDTVLAVARLAGIEDDAGPLDRDGPRRESLARCWADELLPDLVTARGKALDPVIDELAERLARLADHGVLRFRFQDFSKLLKDQVRSRWSMLWAGARTALDVDGELEDLARAVRPPSTYEEREAFESLVAHVSEALEAVPTSSRTRSYLHRLWIFLWSHAAEDGGALPSQRQLSELLDIPRARFKELYVTLARTVERCHEALPGRKTPQKPSHEIREQLEVLR